MLFFNYNSQLDGISNVPFELSAGRVRELCERPARDAVDGPFDVDRSRWTTYRDHMRLMRNGSAQYSLH
jgi:hypothetical protein